MSDRPDIDAIKAMMASAESGNVDPVNNFGKAMQFTALARWYMPVLVTYIEALETGIRAAVKRANDSDPDYALFTLREIEDTLAALIAVKEGKE